MKSNIQAITTQQLDEAYVIAAELVAKFGDVHLPVFQRLHREIQQINQAIEIKTIALNLYSANNKNAE